MNKQILIALTLCVLFVGFASADGEASAIIGIESGSGSGSVMMPISVTNGANVGSIHVKMTFNPEIVTVTSVTNGAMDRMLANLEDVGDGYVHIIAYQAGSPGLDGNFNIALVTFKSVSSSGSCPLGINVITFKDRTPTGNVMAYTVSNGVYTAVSPPTPPTPVPPSPTPTPTPTPTPGWGTIAIRAGDGGDLPTSIPVGENFTVLITDDNSSIGAGANVTFRLPYDTDDPVYCSTDDSGKVNYTPLITGTLGIDVLNESNVTVANATVEVCWILSNITISPASSTMYVGDTQTFVSRCGATNGDEMPCPVLAWNSTNETVATITTEGVMTARTDGTTTITASAGNVTSNGALVTVRTVCLVLSNITISPASSTMYVGDTQMFLSRCGATNGDEMTCPVLAWNSTNETVATITTEGVMTARTDGTTTITASAGNVTSNGALVTVSYPAPVTLQLYPGWNLIAVPVNDPDANTAAELASKIDGCKEVVKWDASTQTYVPRTKIGDDWAGTDFAITTDMGIFVNVEGATNVSFGASSL